MEKYFIGDSVSYGNMFCEPSRLTEVNETDFFNMIERSLKTYNFERYRDVVFKKSNLKKGITIGSDYFVIKHGKRID